MRRGILPWVVRDQSAWMEQLLAAQIEEFRPDVILTHSLCDLRPAFWSRMRSHYRLLVGQIASPLSTDIDLTAFDLMLSSLPNFVERFRPSGLQAELFRLAFDPLVLEMLEATEKQVTLQESTIDVSFVGSLSSHHGGRLKWLEHVCRETPVQVWGQGVDSLPEDSSIRKAYRGPAWGIDMFRILRRSRISLNHHIEISGPYANNMRLYETTGVGTLLLTDWKQNLAEMFEPGAEVAVYRTPAECVETIGYYLNEEAERNRTARAGQERTLRDHTYRQRMAQLVEFGREPIVNPGLKRWIADWVPPHLRRLLRGSTADGAVRYSGDFRTWDDARRHSLGYDAPAIVERVKQATLKVQRGEAAYERDSVLFDRVEHSYPLLAGLLRAALANGGRLNVVDIGGSLGSTFFQCRSVLECAASVRWCVVEQPVFAGLRPRPFRERAAPFLRRPGDVPGGRVPRRRGAFERFALRRNSARAPGDGRPGGSEGDHRPHSPVVRPARSSDRTVSPRFRFTAFPPVTPPGS